MTYIFINNGDTNIHLGMVIQIIQDWFGEWGFVKEKKTKPKKKSGFVQWRKELQNPDFEVNKPV